MRNTLYALRPAIAMIELIFAIVVMGIVMLSVPQLLNTASQSGYVAIQQEAINEASTQVNIIMGHYWDENNITGHDITVLNTTNGDVNLRAAAGTGPAFRRAGTPDKSHRQFGKTQYAASPIGSEAGDRDDIDDFNGLNRTLHLEQTSVTSDYIEPTTVNLASTVSYIADALAADTYVDPGVDNNLIFNLNVGASVGTTNIKHIQVRLTSNSGASELNKTIILHAFSCNIGSYQLEEK